MSSKFPEQIDLDTARRVPSLKPKPIVIFFYFMAVILKNRYDVVTSLL